MTVLARLAVIVFSLLTNSGGNFGDDDGFFFDTYGSLPESQLNWLTFWRAGEGGRK